MNLLLTSTALSLRLDSVTVRMIDGTSLGGRIMTFPNADLSRRFGDTLIVGGSSRPFEFMLDFGCVAATGALVDVVVLDGFGIPHVLKTSATWQ